MNEDAKWVIDTSTYTHLARAGHTYIIEELAPNGIVLVPMAVSIEIEKGRASFPVIPTVGSATWARLTKLDEEERWTELLVKAKLGGPPDRHLGEAAAIACARHRDLVVILDDRAAIEASKALGVPYHDTLWLVIEAYTKLFDRDKDKAAAVIDDLVETDMYLPIDSGESLLVWAYENGLLP